MVLIMRNCKGFNYVSTFQKSEKIKFERSFWLFIINDFKKFSIMGAKPKLEWTKG